MDVPSTYYIISKTFIRDCRRFNGFKVASLAPANVMTSFHLMIAQLNNITHVLIEFSVGSLQCHFLGRFHCFHGVTCQILLLFTV